MRNFDFTPFYRSSVGFDRMFDLLDSATSETVNQSYPPYNIEKTGDDSYRIAVAVAGFTQDELDVEVHNNTLKISGQKQNRDGEGEYLHRGIATRNFERKFELADHVIVDGAGVENGLLYVDLVREVPEALKPRKIEIAKRVKQKLINA